MGVTSERSVIDGSCAREPSNLLGVNFEFADDACECIAMHSKILRSLAEVASMLDQERNDVALLKFTNRIPIRSVQVPHLFDDLV